MEDHSLEVEEEEESKNYILEKYVTTVEQSTERIKSNINVLLQEWNIAKL